MGSSSIPRNHHWQRGVQPIRLALRGNVGSAILELAIVLSFFGVPLFLGTVQSAVLLFNYSEIANAANVAAIYGMRSSTFASDTSGMIAAGRAEAYSIGENLTVAPTLYYACSAALGGTRFSNQIDATSACTGGGNHSLQFVKVTASASIEPPVHLPGLPASFTLQSVAVMEVQE